MTPAAAPLTEEISPREGGFDERRLAEIEERFAPYVDSGRLSGWLITVARDGRVVYVGSRGFADLERSRPVARDTIWRVYSMTKPVVAVAALLLIEAGRARLDDPISQWIPSFAEPRVYLSPGSSGPETRAAETAITVRHLLSHTAGLTYGFQRCHPVDALYRESGYDFLAKPGVDLAAAVEDWAALPLVFEPGTGFTYSVATSVLGRLVEIWSGETLDVALASLVLGPLEMVDTGFWCPERDEERLAQLYLPGAEGAVAFDEWGRHALHRPRLLDGGGGLVSTAGDYQRFMAALLGRGPECGPPLVSAELRALLGENQLPDGLDLATVARDRYRGADSAGLGFGLGVSVVMDPVANASPVSAGTLSWGGAASTTFFVDPVEGLAAALYTQLLPTGTYPLHRELEEAVYRARA